jgi:phosphopantetheinyl transferase
MHQFESTLQIESSAAITVALFPWGELPDRNGYRLNCVRHLCGNSQLELGKTESGQPFLVNSTIGISFSHTENLLAIAISGNHPPGVDIEKIRIKIKTIASRVFSEDELNMILSFPELKALHILWGTKEAVYKSQGKRGVIFKTDIIIHPFDFNPGGGKLKATLKNGGNYDLEYKFVDEEFVVVYTTGFRADT